MRRSASSIVKTPAKNSRNHLLSEVQVHKYSFGIHLVFPFVVHDFFLVLLVESPLYFQTIARGDTRLLPVKKAYVLSSTDEQQRNCSHTFACSVRIRYYSIGTALTTSWCELGILLPSTPPLFLADRSPMLRTACPMSDSTRLHTIDVQYREKIGIYTVKYCTYRWCCTRKNAASRNTKTTTKEGDVILSSEKENNVAATARLLKVRVHRNAKQLLRSHMHTAPLSF